MGSVETRKVVKVGAKSLAISIPKKWAQSIGIGPGDSVDLVLNKDGTIVIRPHRPSVRMELVNALTINASEHSVDEVMRLIEGGYMDGYDTIVLKGVSDIETLSSMLSSLSLKLPGVVTFNEGDTITIKIALSDSVIQFDEVFQRMVNVVTSMFENVDRYLKTSKDEYAKKVLILDDELDRMYFLGLRLISKKMAGAVDVRKELKEATDFAMLIKFLEIVGDCIDRSVRVLMEHPELIEKYRDILSSLYLTAMKLILDSIYAYRSSNVRFVTKIPKRKSEYIREVRKLREELAAEVAPITGILTELEMIADIISDLIEIASMKCARELSE